MSTSAQDFEQGERSLRGGWFPPPYRIPANATSPKLANSIIAASGVCRLYGFTATSTNVAAQFILCFDTNAVPAAGALPLFTVNVAAASPGSVYFGSVGRSFDHGIVLCNSTTQGTLTIGAADTLFDVQYVY
ncbi:MAG: hypothetical protein E6J20_18550 [Chloroflexi bacterium]|nr:MAG: hypothetical protein E6J20_18550 [Chloroflexota bacterium]HMC69891.1 hypothetical protein [Mycobacteriales bacterium]